MTTKKAKYGSHKDAVIQCADGTRTMHEVAALAGVDYDQARSTLRRLGLMHLVITTPQKIEMQAAEIARMRAALNAEKLTEAGAAEYVRGLKDARDVCIAYRKDPDTCESEAIGALECALRIGGLIPTEVRADT